MQVTHFRILVENFESSFLFYRDTLGLPTRFPLDPPYAEFDLGGDKYLGIFEKGMMAEAIGTNATTSSGDSFVLILHVENLAMEEKRLRDLGIEIVAGPADQPDWGLRVLHLRDPDGNLIELFEPLKATTS